MKKAKQHDINIMVWAVENTQIDYPFYLEFNVMKDDKMTKHEYYNKNCALALLKDAQVGKVELWVP